MSFENIQSVEENIKDGRLEFLLLLKMILTHITLILTLARQNPGGHGETAGDLHCKGTPATSRSEERLWLLLQDAGPSRPVPSLLLSVTLKGRQSVHNMQGRT